MPEPISDRRWNELHRLAWSPEFRPPEGTPDRVRHDALRDAVNEVKRLRGLAHSNMPCGQRLAEILAEHRVMMRVGEQGQLPKLLTDLLQWNAITVEGETHYLREELDHIRTELDARRTHHPDRSTRTEEAMSDERPWKLQLICCGRDDGTVTCETRAAAELTRSAYISAEGHDRQAILTGPPGAVETDLVALLGEYLGALGKGDWSETVYADMRARLEQVCTSRDAATARAEKAEAELARVKAEIDARIAAESADAAAGSYAGRAEQAEARVEAARQREETWRDSAMQSAARAEKAEAALAEMRERLGEPVVQWAVMLDDTESSPLPEKVARRMASDPFRTTLLTRDTYPDTAWRSADATPRTALERAADEQGVQLSVDIDKLTAGADLQLTDEEFAEWTSAWQCTAPCCSEDATEQGDDAREVVIGAGSPETSVLTHCPTCGSPEWLDDGRRGWNPVDVECEVCAGTYDEQGDGEG